MALLSFIVETIDKKEVAIDNVISYELCKDVNAACDGLRLSYCTNNSIGEAVKIKAFLEKKLVFNGLVDTQQEVLDKDGYKCFIYARSTGCILVDIEAEPVSYSSVTANALVFKNASEYGFNNKLPKICNESTYVVTKGTSCYGAINNFVKCVTGKNIAVDVDNNVILPSGDGVIDINNYDILSEKRCVNRGDLIYKIDYKVDGDIGYAHHIKSRFLENAKIESSKKLNLSSYSEWQRDNVAKNELSRGCERYYTIELELAGCVMPNLYDSVRGDSKMGDFDGYYVSSYRVALNKNGESTRLSLAKKLDLMEVSYVA